MRYEYIFSVASCLIMKHKQNAVLTPVHQKPNSALTTLLNFDTLLLISSPNASFYCIKIGYFFPFKISKKRKKATGFAKALARPQNNFFRLLSWQKSIRYHLIIITIGINRKHKAPKYHFLSLINQANLILRSILIIRFKYQHLE